MYTVVFQTSRIPPAAVNTWAGSLLNKKCIHQTGCPSSSLWSRFPSSLDPSFQPDQTQCLLLPVKQGDVISENMTRTRMNSQKKKLILMCCQAGFTAKVAAKQRSHIPLGCLPLNNIQGSYHEDFPNTIDGEEVAKEIEVFSLEGFWVLNPLLRDRNIV